MQVARVRLQGVSALPDFMEKELCRVVGQSVHVEEQAASLQPAQFQNRAKLLKNKFSVARSRMEQKDHDDVLAEDDRDNWHGRKHLCTSPFTNSPKRISREK
jgi:hypothetical protein